MNFKTVEYNGIQYPELTLDQILGEVRYGDSLDHLLKFLTDRGPVQLNFPEDEEKILSSPVLGSSHKLLMWVGRLGLILFVEDKYPYNQRLKEITLTSPKKDLWCKFVVSTNESYTFEFLEQGYLRPAANVLLRNMLEDFGLGNEHEWSRAV